MGSISESKDVRFPSLTATMQERLKEAPQYSQRRCIFRVPQRLRQANEEAYTPLLVSIGPLHHNDNRLLPMEAHKLKYLQSFLEHSQMNAANLLNLCIGIVKDRETQIRECYADPIDLPSDDFVQMVLIDSAYIIQLFRMDMARIQRDAEDYIYRQPFLLDPVFRDILLEENQLPFFIFDELYNAAFQTNASNSSSVPSFTEITCWFLEVDLNGNSNVNQPANYFHLLHLLSFRSRPTGPTNRTLTADKVEGILLNDDLVFPTATQLHQAGVKFQAIKTGNRDNICSSINIEFDKEKGILKIPTLCVSDTTEYISRNLIAFEQLNYSNTRYITDFHFFLNWLINTPEDVQLLVEKGIIRSFMGSHKQVADLINSLDNHAYMSQKGFYYEQISLDLNRHCKKKWNRYRATLMHTYFKHPWAAISVVYAIALLLFTIAQLVVGIMAIP